MLLERLNKGIVYILSAAIFICSCSSEPSDLKSYTKYIHTPDNGYIKERHAGPFLFSARHLPPKYLALKETTQDHSSYDSIYQSYAHSVNFQFTISPNPEKAAGDVTRSSIHSLEQYNSRLRTLNFHLKEYWTLETPSCSFHPVLTQLEQTGGLTDYRRIQLAFASPDSISKLEKPWTLTFDDEIWGTGVNRWRWE